MNVKITIQNKTYNGSVQSHFLGILKVYVPELNGQMIQSPTDPNTYILDGVFTLPINQVTFYEYGNLISDEFMKLTRHHKLKKAVYRRNEAHHLGGTWYVKLA